MEERIKKIFMELGADVCGIANVDRFKDAPKGFHPVDIYKDCKSVVVFAKCMPKGTAYVNPRFIYSKAIDMSFEELDNIAYVGAIELEKLGGITVPLPSDTPVEYCSETMESRGLLSMRHAAMLAGIGSMGKNTLIINKRYGNYIHFGAILTNLNLKSDPLSEKMCIEGCTLCLDNCPTKALDGQTVNQKLCRQYAYAKSERGFSICNCNKCRIICPNSLGGR